MRLILVTLIAILIGCSNASESAHKTPKTFITKTSRQITYGLAETDAAYFIAGSDGYFENETTTARMTIINKNSHITDSLFVDGKIIPSIHEFENEIYFISIADYQTYLYSLNQYGEVNWKTEIPFVTKKFSIGNIVLIDSSQISIGLNTKVDSLKLKYAISVVHYDLNGNFIARNLLDTAYTNLNISYIDYFNDGIFFQSYWWGDFYLVAESGDLIWKKTLTYEPLGISQQKTPYTISKQGVTFASTVGLVNIDENSETSVIYYSDSLITFDLIAISDDYLVLGDIDYHGGTNIPSIAKMKTTGDLVFRERLEFLDNYLIESIKQTADGGYILYIVPFNGDKNFLFIKTDANGKIDESVIANYLQSLED